MPGHGLMNHLRRLSTALCVAATPCATADQGETSLSLQLLRDLEHAASSATARNMFQPKCYESAVAYVAAESPASPGVFDEKVLFHVVGPHGHWSFEFAAGTSLAIAAQEINDISGWTWIAAVVSKDNPNRMKLWSIHTILQHSIEITQHAGSPCIYAQAFGGTAMQHWIDYGCHLGVPVCAEPAALYLNTGSALETGGAGSTMLIVQGHAQWQMFTFASGTSQGSIINAINTFTSTVGVEAVQSQVNQQRIEVRSRFVGDAAFVAVHQIDNVPPIVVGTPVGGELSYTLQANGRDRLPGDVTCDRLVNVSDLLHVIQQWGACQPPPAVCAADLTGDSIVNVADLLTVINHWGMFD